MPDEAHARIAARLGGRLIARAPLLGGVSADVQRIDVAAPDGRVERWVVRAHRIADGKPPEPAAAATEHALLLALADAGLPVPRPRLLDLSGAILPAPYLVLPFVEGTTAIPPEARWRAIERMAGFLATLHRLDPPALALPPRIDPLAELPAWIPADGPLAAVADRLSAVQHRPPTRRCLLHGDLWPGNVIWRGDALAAVIDWEDAALGDPASDVAVSRLELTWAHGPAEAAAFTADYTRQGGAPLDPDTLAPWDLYVSLAALSHMGAWGLPPPREAHMRATAHAFAEAAARRVFAEL